MKTIDPFPQSSDGGAVMKEWQDELPPAEPSSSKSETALMAARKGRGTASIRAQRVVRGLGGPARDAKRAWKAGPPGATDAPHDQPMKPMKPIRLRASPTRRSTNR